MTTDLIEDSTHAVDAPLHEVRMMMQGESPEQSSLKSIQAVLRAGHPLIVAWSSGKDSSVLANLVFRALKAVAAEGIRTPVAVVHSDTRVENPFVRSLADDEVKKMREYAKAHSLPIQVLVGRPPISQAWPTRVIGGRALPPFPGGRTDCSVDWKIKTNERTMKNVTSALAAKGWKEPVVCTGVRMGESAARDAVIKQRGERFDTPWRNCDGRLMLSPLLQWTFDDIWEQIGLCHVGEIESYSDFADTIEFYRSSGGTSCVVVSDMAMQKFSKPCSARGGCWTCTAVQQDRSMQNLIASDEAKYGFMKPLADLRDFIANTQFDWSRRQFVQRTIKDGYIVIGADTYSPDMLKELLRYTLTAQEESGVNIIDEPTLISIDARWSLYGLHPPFEAIRVWLDVTRDGARYYPPKYDKPFPQTPVPVLGKIWVGNDWDDQRSSLYAEGLRHPAWEMFSESCGPDLRVFANGKVGLDLDEGLEVDAEGAGLFMEFEAERKASEPITDRTDWTSAYMYYLLLGTVQPAKGQSSMVDDLLRRTSWRQRNNLHGQRSMDELYERCDVRMPRQEALF